MTIDAILYMIFHELHFSTSVRWSRALRPVLLLTFPENRRLRAAFYNLRRTLIDVLPVFGLFGACLIFISIVSVTLLGNTKLTYPNASVYNSYKSHLGEFVVKTVAKRKEKLDEAFNLISTRTSDGKLGVSQHTFLHLMHIVTPKRSEDSMKVIFYLLDKNKSGYLSKHEFERLSEYMQAKFEEIELSYAFFNTYISKFHYIYTSRFIMSKELLDNAGLNDHSKNKVFYLKTDNASIEILMFRMFEKEIEELVDDLTNKHITTKLRAHDPFSHL
ncbi:two pore calcium channel 1-like [Schistosoma japonicum]|uniref:Two pore calcium channel 1-like n=1 Tax=Schistosoma japonicum TaxID=6182 RepID=A0A4Z2DR79_SCHJA|nr:two pore calcium channel 1-like [Schistosoma japonicum]